MTLASLYLYATFVVQYTLPWRETSLISVSVNQNESIDSALRRFNQKIQGAGLLREVKEKSHYEKPSEKRRKAKRRGGRPRSF